MSKVSIFHIGPQKSATTWQYHCFREHPEICTATTDAIHYFDIHHTRGDDWYLSHFPGREEGQLLLDMTPSYIRSAVTPERMQAYNAKAKIIVCLREPIARAFSHYWHEKKKARMDYDFEEALKKYNLFANWIEPGFYAQHIEHYLKFFKRDQIHVQDFLKLEQDAEGFLKDTLAFIGVDKSFKPEALDKRINIAKPQKSPSEQKLDHIARKLHIHGPLKALRNKGFIKQGDMEQLNNVPDEFISQLLEVFEPETQRLEKLLDMDLNTWRNVYNRKGQAA